jgi:hypothetical protein
VLSVLRHTYRVAKEKLIPRLPDNDKRDSQQRFADLGAKVFSTPKSEIDKRESRWKSRKNKRT